MRFVITPWAGIIPAMISLFTMACAVQNRAASESVVKSNFDVQPSDEEGERKFFREGLFVECLNTDGRKLKVTAKSQRGADFSDIHVALDWEGFVPVSGLQGEFEGSGGWEGSLSASSTAVTLVEDGGEARGDFTYDETGRPVLSWYASADATPRQLLCKPLLMVCEKGVSTTMPYYFIRGVPGDAPSLEVSKLAQFSGIQTPLMAHSSPEASGEIQDNTANVSFGSTSVVGPGSLVVTYDSAANRHRGVLTDGSDSHELNCNFGVPLRH